MAVWVQISTRIVATGISRLEGSESATSRRLGTQNMFLQCFEWGKSVWPVKGVRAGDVSERQSETDARGPQCCEIRSPGADLGERWFRRHSAPRWISLRHYRASSAPKALCVRRNSEKPRKSENHKGVGTSRTQMSFSE